MYFDDAVAYIHGKTKNCYVKYHTVDCHLALPIHFVHSHLVVECPESCWDSGVGWFVSASWFFRGTLQTKDYESTSVCVLCIIIHFTVTSIKRLLQVC